MRAWKWRLDSAQLKPVLCLASRSKNRRLIFIWDCIKSSQTLALTPPYQFWRNFWWAIKNDRNALCAPEKVQRFSTPLFQLFCALHATAVSLGSNAVKLQVWKVKNTLMSKYVINLFEHLNDFKWKNSKLESCRSRRDL